jgi:hypothetical protein
MLRDAGDSTDQVVCRSPDVGAQVPVPAGGSTSESVRSVAPLLLAAPERSTENDDAAQEDDHSDGQGGGPLDGHSSGRCAHQRQNPRPFGGDEVPECPRPTVAGLCVGCVPHTVVPAQWRGGCLLRWLSVRHAARHAGPPTTFPAGSNRERTAAHPRPPPAASGLAQPLPTRRRT